MSKKKKDNFSLDQNKGKVKKIGHLMRVIDSVRQDLGLRAELVADTLFNSPPEDHELPGWYISHRMTGKGSGEDKRGVDMVFQTNRGPLLVQIKSSKRNKSAFEFVRDHDPRFSHKYKNMMPICVVVVDVTKSPDVLFDQFVGEIEAHFALHSQSICI